ncbi:hypothetical protein JHK87_052785 [Glycine soja]|nr:hypothetical protein JHK87_052785 [Glycine soja]
MLLVYAFAGLVLEPLNIVMHGSETWLEDSSFLFDNSHYGLEGEAKVTWDEKYRAGAEQVVFREEGSKGKEDERQRKAIVKALLEAAMDEDEDEEEEGK